MSDEQPTEEPDHEPEGEQPKDARPGDGLDPAPGELPKDRGETRTGLQYRGADGEWHEITAEPKRTGDPELDELWAMSFGDFEKVLEDESHPLHTKAKQVSAEITKPLAEVLSRAVKPFASEAFSSFTTKALTDAFPKFDFSSLYPKLDTSWISKLATPKHDFPNFTNYWADLPRLSTPELHPQRARVIDFHAVEPPDATMAEIEEATEVKAHEVLLQLVELQRQQLEQARADSEADKEALEISKQALKVTEEGVEESRGSKRAAWAAAIIAGVGILVTVAFGIISLLSSS